MKRARTAKSVPVPEVNSAQQVNDSPHPLLLFPVLNHLLETIPFDCEEFKNYRLVSKEWAKASLPVWRKEAWLNLKDVNGAALTLEQFLKMTRLLEDPFQLIEEDDNNNYFRKYKISFQQNLCFRGRWCLEFWTKIGPLMTHLNICDSRMSSGEDFTRILLEMTPNLKSLGINGICTRSYNQIPYPFLLEREEATFFIGNWDERVRPLVASSVQPNLTELQINLLSYEFSISWTYFFTRLPNIKKLTIEDLPEPVSGNFPLHNEDVPTLELVILLHSMRAVKQQMGPHYFSQLKELDFSHEQNSALELFPSTILPILRDLNLPLTSLSFDISVDTNVDNFRQMLSLYSPSLEVLEVYRGSGVAPFSQDFPYGVNIPNLKKLTFRGPICKNLNFLANTPNLTELFIGKSCHSKFSECTRSCNTDIIAKTDFSKEPLKNLVLPQMKEFFIENTICFRERVKALARIMPNLRKLRVGLRSDGFTMMCTVWTKLTYLHIDLKEVSEMGMLGMMGRKMYTKPNITSLKDLETFILGSSLRNEDLTKGQLTSNSILHGLLLCQSLETVMLGCSVLTQSRKKVEEMLGSKKIRLVISHDDL